MDPLHGAFQTSPMEGWTDDMVDKIAAASRRACRAVLAELADGDYSDAGVATAICNTVSYVQVLLAAKFSNNILMPMAVTFAAHMKEDTALDLLRDHPELQVLLDRIASRMRAGALLQKDMSAAVRSRNS